MDESEYDEQQDEDVREKGIAPFFCMCCGLCGIISLGVCFVVGLFIYVIWGSIILQDEKDARDKDLMPESWCAAVLHLVPTASIAISWPHNISYLPGRHDGYKEN